MEIQSPPLDVIRVLDALALAREPKPSTSGEFMRYRTKMDDRVCPICSPHNGKIWPFDNPSAWVVPPLHVNCRCELEFESWLVIPQEGPDRKIESVEIEGIPITIDVQ